MKIPITEVLRYLGCTASFSDKNVLSSINSSIQSLNEVITPKVITKRIKVTLQKSNIITFGSVFIQSRDLFLHLTNCKEILLFAATLGVQADQLIRTYSAMDMSKAVILHACAAAAIEQFCDECQESIARELSLQGLHQRPRYSPGYGDFSLSYQQELLNLLDAPKKIGLTSTESQMLSPSKSVTAIIGLTTDPQACHVAKCMTCTAKNCPFRKDSETK